MSELPELSAQVLQALQQGRTIDAIKRLREERGIGLKEAKDLVDAWQAGKPLPGTTASSAAPGGKASGLSAEVLCALQQGRKIEAIRLLREERGIGLKDAKEAVEQALASDPQLASGCVRRAGGSRPLVIFIFLLLGVAAWLLLLC